MKRFVILSVFLCVFALVVMVFEWDPTAAVRGHWVARFDLARGHYRILGYGLSSPWRNEYARLLKERYGIEFKSVAGCIVSQPLLSYADAYDSESRAAAEAKFGREIFTDAWEDAQRGWLHGALRTQGGNAVDWLFHYENAKTSSAACFRDFTTGASMRKIAEKCGRPDAETGHDEYIFVYNFAKGEKVTIRGPYLRHVDQVTYETER